MTEQNNAAESTAVKRRLSTVMLVLTLAVVGCGIVVVISERSTMGKARAFYDVIQDKLDQGELITRSEVQAIAETDHPRGKFESSKETLQVVDDYRWSGYLQEYVVTVTYVRSSAVASRVSIDTTSRFSQAEKP